MTPEFSPAIETVVATMKALAALPPLAVQLEASPEVVTELLAAAAIPERERAGYARTASFGYVGGINLVAVDTLAPGGWRLIDNKGNVMDEGTIQTEAETRVRAWLERQADYYMDHGVFTSNMPLDVTGFGVRADLGAGSVRDAGLFNPLKVRELVFYACWLGSELTTTRRR